MGWVKEDKISIECQNVWDSCLALMKKIFSTTHHISRTLALKKQSFHHTSMSEGGIHVTPLPFLQYFPIYRILYSISIGSISNSI